MSLALTRRFLYNRALPHYNPLPIEDEMQHPSEFIEELDAFDPHWKTRYKTPLDAAKAAGNVPLYWHWIRNGDGKIRDSVMAGVPDTVAGNAARRAVYERMRLIAGWGSGGSGDSMDLDPDDYESMV